MNRIMYRFYEELNDYLPEERKKTDFEAVVPSGASLGCGISRVGVPLGAVDFVLVNGEPAGFDRLLRDGDRVSVYPVFESFDIRTETMIKRRPLRRLRFIAGPDLTGLLAALKEIGFDAVHAPGLSFEEIAARAAEEKRVLLTTKNRRDVARVATHAVSLEGVLRENRLEAVLQRLQLPSGPKNKTKGTGSE